MVKSHPDVLNRAFAALADPTRRAIVERLSHGPRSLGEIAAPFRMSLPAVHKHLAVLEDAGLVSSRRDGRQRMIRLRDAPVRQIEAWLRRYWDARLDGLEAYVKGER